MNCKEQKNIYTKDNHTFAICAYKESPYLEECIKSLKRQSVLGKIIIISSTPSRFLNNLSDKYCIPLYIRDGKSNIADDWNFAYERTDTQLITIAHQDDIYDKHYLEEVLKQINRAKHPLIIFSDYGEIRNKAIVKKNKILQVKRIMLFPLRFKYLWKSKFMRRRILAFGSAICCPSVTYVKNNLPQKIFEKGYGAALDWQAWEKLSRLKGDFVFCNKILMFHRIHEDSETTKIIENSNRTKEDYEMYCKFWPRFIADLLIFFYKKSQESNSLWKNDGVEERTEE